MGTVSSAVRVSLSKVITVYSEVLRSAQAIAALRRVPVEQVLRELKEVGIVQVMHQSSGSLTNEANMELS
ncbi:hypothetical protein [Glutamicibacter sp. NPDC087344]|uniref:hypothetical protein n=1 Tax=Glutamicibacter sp. NPDC087344 TaxID=3363994 RepID=UPI00382F6BD6